jgi:hypothetical protein
MPLIVRQKVCIPCASSKRKCDKQLPECRRCLDKDMDCVYPQPRKQRRDTTARRSHASGDFVTSVINEAHTINGFEGWDGIEDISLDVSLSGFIDVSRSTLEGPVTGSSIPGLEHRIDMANAPSPWFLGEETWVLQQGKEEPDCVTSAELEPFIQAVNEMLKSWTKTGHNNFIHHRLYERGMPKCLQHAFTTLATYVGRTSAMEETILRIVEEHALTLVQEDCSTTIDAQGIQDHLGRILALFIYLFIRLFGSSVRLRASAEIQLPILRRWLTQIWTVSKEYRGEDQLLGQGPPFISSYFDIEYNASSELWRLWILTESVRRTHLVASTVANMYDVMAKGWAECSGAVMCTARRGLWEADSALKWYELSCTDSPLLVPSLQPEYYIAQFSADEFDEFVKLLWTFIVGADKVRCWIDKGRMDLPSNAISQ